METVVSEPKINDEDGFVTAYGMSLGYCENRQNEKYRMTFWKDSYLFHIQGQAPDNSERIWESFEPDKYASAYKFFMLLCKKYGLPKFKINGNS
jgi:hypothetical protein